jgi:hypothetical protein
MATNRPVSQKLEDEELEMMNTPMDVMDDEEVIEEDEAMTDDEAATDYEPLNNNNKNKKTTKKVFSQLINSFKRISNEAARDSKLLQNATSKL